MALSVFRHNAIFGLENMEWRDTVRIMADVSSRFDRAHTFDGLINEQTD